jgi:hypothetical protein
MQQIAAAVAADPLLRVGRAEQLAGALAAPLAAPLAAFRAAPGLLLLGGLGG